MNLTPSDLAHLRSWIGKSVEDTDVLSTRLIDSFNATIAPFIFADDREEAPLGIHWCLSPPCASLADLGPDGHVARHALLPPVPLPVRMWAGGEIQFIESMQIGETVTRRSRIEDIEIKSGQSGSLCFVRVRHDYASERRGLLLSERQDIVYRDAVRPGSTANTSANAASPSAAHGSADLQWTIAAGPASLFRYSAITFNSHRIHYDYPYATGVEQYAGLLVHGPLQATYLLNLAASLMGKRPKGFAYRGVAPLIAGPDFTAGASHGDDAATAVSCWTRSAAGSLAMQARATGEIG